MIASDFPAKMGLAMKVLSLSRGGWPRKSGSTSRWSPAGSLAAGGAFMLAMPFGQSKSRGPTREPDFPA